MRVTVRLLATLLAGLALSAAACGDDVPTAPSAAVNLQLRDVGCVKPIALPDKWREHNPTSAAWTESSQFARYSSTPNPGSLLNSPDVYLPPGVTGTGFTNADHGLQLALRLGNPSSAVVTGNEVLAVSLTGGRGAAEFLGSLTGCVDQVTASQGSLATESGNLAGPLTQGITLLIARDPLATWNTTANTIDGSCAPACAAESPRILILPLFDPDRYQHLQATGSSAGCSTGGCVNVVGVARFFVSSVTGGVVSGRLMRPSP